MAEVVWRREARDELDGIIDHIDRFDPVAADKIGRRLIEVADSLSDFPRRGRPAADESREMTIVPPYVLRYVIDDDRVVILLVRHGRQRPAGER